MCFYHAKRCVCVCGEGSIVKTLGVTSLGVLDSPQIPGFQENGNLTTHNRFMQECYNNRES